MDRESLMTCKFERVLASDGSVVLHVSGRIDGTFRRHAARDNGEGKKLEGGFAIDLAEVTLVSREAIRTLSLVDQMESNCEIARLTCANGSPERGTCAVRMNSELERPSSLSWRLP